MKLIICLAVFMLITVPVWGQKQGRDAQGTQFGISNPKGSSASSVLGSKKTKTDLKTRTQKSSTANVLGTSNLTKTKTQKSPSLLVPSKDKSPKPTDKVKR